jgi:hypothetical protein
MHGINSYDINEENVHSRNSLYAGMVDARAARVTGRDFWDCAEGRKRFEQQGLTSPTICSGS